MYVQHQVYVIQVLWLLARGNETELRRYSVRPRNKNRQRFNSLLLL